MGLSSILKLIGPAGGLIAGADMDTSLDSGLGEIARSLPKMHPFRRLMDLLESGSPGDPDPYLLRQMEEIVAGGMGFCAILPKDLADFSAYIHGDLDRQWEELFPGRSPGVLGWLNYVLVQKRIEETHKAEPKSPGAVGMKHSYVELMMFLRRALETHSTILNERY